MNEVIINSFTAGALQTIIGHPFDTVKTLIQTNQSYSEIKRKIKNNGYGHFYKGYFPMLLGGCLQNCMIFSTEHFIKKKLDIKSEFVSGFLAGAFTSIVMTPCELIKCNLQTNNDFKFKKLNYFRGLNLTILRDSIGIGLYFSIYNKLQKETNNPLINGGIAGMLSWIYSYPIDSIKTLYQLDPKTTIIDIVKKKKLSILNGMPVMIIRAFFVNAGIFYTFEKLKN